MLLTQLEYGDARRFFLYVAGVAAWAYAADEPASSSRNHDARGPSAMDSFLTSDDGPGPNGFDSVSLLRAAARGRTHGPAFKACVLAMAPDLEC
jgi:hypothetical protein